MIVGEDFDIFSVVGLTLSSARRILTAKGIEVTAVQKLVCENDANDEVTDIWRVVFIRSNEYNKAEITVCKPLSG